MLANRGKLSLDDDIRKYLPEVADFGKKITIRHLIYHTSGLRDQWEMLAMAGWRLDDVITKEHILKMVSRQRELNFEPGAENLYSNTGYTLLAVIVERVSGQSFREFTEENIFKPLGMTNTHFHDDHEMIVKNRAYSYAPAKSGFRLAALNYANVGATSLFTTAEDLAKWVLNFEDKKVGGQAVIEQMHEEGVLTNGKKINYAFGLGLSPYRGLKTVGHSGGDAGYRSFDFWFPTERFGVVVLSNHAIFNPTRTAMQIADIYLADKLAAEEQKPKPVAPVVAKVSKEILDEYAGKYLLDGARIVTVAREGDILTGQPTGQQKAEMIPESETKFYVKGVEGWATFERDEKGKVARFTLVANGRNQLAKRIVNEPLAANQLAEYAGDYYSPELRTTYTLAVRDGQLVAEHQRHQDIKLTQLDSDLFSGSQWFFQRVEFTRDTEKRLTGFRLTGGRIRNLRFDKQK